MKRNYYHLAFNAFIGSVAFLVLVATLALLVTRGRCEGVGANEASAFATARFLNESERRYAESNPALGFACDISILEKVGVIPTYERDKSGHILKSGYVFALTNCQRDAKGRSTNYRLAGEPQQYRVTGRRAFCSDQSGTIWYDDHGSAADCLSKKLALP